MAEPTEPQESAEVPQNDSATAPVAAAEHVGAPPVVPAVAESATPEPVLAEPVTPEPVLVEPTTVDPVVAEPVVAPATPDPAPAAQPAAPVYTPAAAPDAAAPAAAAQSVVYVETPTPPAPRNNRGFGVLISLLGTAAFALLYLGAAAIVFAVTPNTRLESTFNGFLASDAFWVPVAAYAVFSIVFALIGIAVAGDARSFREARLHPMVTALGIGLLVRWGGFYAGGAAETRPFFSFLLYAIPIGMGLLCIRFIMTSRPMELPTAWTERLALRLQKDRERLDHLGRRLARLLGFERNRA